jgi:ribosomal protein L11 methyltransferase
VAEVLGRYAYRGVAIESGPEGLNTGPVIVKAYLPVDDQLHHKQRRIGEALWHLGQIRPVPDPTFRPVQDADWAEAWKERLNTLHIGQHIVVRPSWRAYTPAPGDVVIQLDPGQAFGTGVHPTTQMCLMALEALLRPGAEVLDLGTGSGILSIAAAKLGAGRVVALDTDAVAVKVARGNALANGVHDVISVGLGSLAEAVGSYDLVVVNILAKVILDMLREGLVKCVRRSGHLVVAGILVDQETEVMGELMRRGLSERQRWQMDDWVCLTVSPGSYSAR